MPIATAREGRVRKAVLPVAGRGTRLSSATRAVPKELLPVIVQIIFVTFGSRVRRAAAED
jgi:dTDP-glucose pyrophosphorylase